MNRLYFKVGTTGLGVSPEGLPDEVLHVCYAMERDGVLDNPVDMMVKPQFRESWPMTSMINGIWPENVQDCPYFKDVRDKFIKMMEYADEVVMDNPRFTRDMCLQSGMEFPNGEKFIDVMDCYTKEHPEMLEGTAKRCSLQSVAQKQGIFFNEKKEESKLLAMRQVYLSLKSPEKKLITEFGDTYNKAHWKCTRRWAAEYACNALERKDTLFDLEAEKDARVNNEKKFALRREEIMRAVKNASSTVRQIEDALLASRVVLHGCDTVKKQDYDMKMVTYEIEGKIYHQSFASEDLDVKIAIDKRKAEHNWFTYNFADTLTAGKNEFELSSAGEQRRCLKNFFRYSGGNRFLPDVERMSPTTKFCYGIAKANKGKDSYVFGFDLESEVGKNWKQDLADDYKRMVDPDRNGINIPLDSLVYDDANGKVVIRGEILTAFRSGKTFYEYCDKDKSKFIDMGSVPMNMSSYMATPRNNAGDAFNVTVLASGSSANCFLVQTKDENFLIDFGTGIRATSAVLKKMKLSLKDIDAVFLTHEHGDHAKLSQSFFDIPSKIYATVGTWQGIGERNKDGLMFNTSNCFMMPEELRLNKNMFSPLVVKRLETCHDTKAPCMYSFEKDGQVLTIATDTGRVTKSVRTAVEKSDVLIIEANHDKYLLQKDLCHDEISKCRVRSEQGHLSNDDTEDLLASLKVHAPAKVMLAHISVGSNTPELVKDMVLRARERNPILHYTSFRVLNQSEAVKVPVRNRPLPKTEDIEVAKEIAKNRGNSL